MKNFKYLFIPIAVIIIVFFFWIDRYPAFKNQGEANITISIGDSVVYDLKNVPKGDFKYYLKQIPMIMEFDYRGEKTTLNNDSLYYVVVVDHLDTNLPTLYFK